MENQNIWQFYYDFGQNNNMILYWCFFCEITGMKLQPNSLKLKKYIFYIMEIPWIMKWSLYVKWILETRLYFKDVLVLFVWLPGRCSFLKSTTLKSVKISKYKNNLRVKITQVNNEKSLKLVWKLYLENSLWANYEFQRRGGN